jgi:hypothetical protein
MNVKKEVTMVNLFRLEAKIKYKKIFIKIIINTHMFDLIMI